MPGSFCNGNPEDQPFVKESQAYCEGMGYRAGGTAVARPITDDPYGSARPTESQAWQRGWNAADGAGGTIDGVTAGCCAYRGVTVP